MDNDRAKTVTAQWNGNKVRKVKRREMSRKKAKIM